jgi:LysR family hydrogen peroxide-inducible transcriptional activator
MTSNLVEGLTSGRLDAIVIATDPDRERLVERLLFDEDFWLATPAGHPLVAQESVTAADLDPSALLLLADGHCLHGQTLEFCGRADLGSAAGADVRAASLETLLHLTAANQGVTLVPRLAVDPDGMKGNLAARPLRGPGQSRRVRLVYRANSPRTAAMEALAEALRRGLPDCVTVLT